MSLHRKQIRRAKARLLVLGALLVAGTSAGIVFGTEQARRQAERTLSSQTGALLELFDSQHRLHLSQTTAALKIMLEESARVGSPVWYPERRRGQLPDLRLGGRTINGDTSVVDRIHWLTGATATYFVRDRDRFFRVSTRILKPDGKRATGIELDPKSRAAAAILLGRPFYGLVDVQGSPYMAGYEPLRGPAGSIIGIAHAGYPIAGMKGIAQIVESSRVLERGFTALVDARGRLLAKSAHATADQARALISPKSRPWHWKVTEITLPDWGFRVLVACSWFDIWAGAAMLALAGNSLVFLLGLFLILASYRKSWRALERTSQATLDLATASRSLAALSSGSEPDPAKTTDSDPILNELGKASAALSSATGHVTRLLEEIQERRAAVRRLLEATADGILTVDRSGVVGDEVSRSAERFFGTTPGGRHIAQLMSTGGTGDSARELWDGCLELLFDEGMPFNDLTSACPRTVSVGGRELELSYKDIRSADGKLARVMIVARDSRADAAVRQAPERPVAECLGWIGDEFRQAAERLGKETLPLTWLPSEKIDPVPYQALFQSLAHVARHAALHGIEMPELRAQAGKPRAGRLTGQLQLVDGRYFLRLIDDGNGAALESLDPVRAEARALGGDLRVVSTPGKGTGVLIWFRKQPRLPVSRAA